MFQTFAYSLPLKNPLLLAGNITLRKRRGILLHNPEMNGWGEAAPLPGFSPESYEELASAVKLRRWDDLSLPSLQFAIDSANQPFAFRPGAVSVNALWFPGREPVNDVVARISGWEKPVVKLKADSSLQLQVLRDLIRARPDVQLRIDGNRQLSLEQTLQLYTALPGEQIEYFEEPLRDYAEYASLWERENIPIALDEALLTPEGKELSEKEFVRAYVLKPTLLGGTHEQNFWISRAKRNGANVIWSSCFESGVGLWHLVNKARGFGAAGLDTGDIFSTQPVDPFPSSIHGRIHIESTKLKVFV